MAEEGPHPGGMSPKEVEEVVGRWLHWVVWLRSLESIRGVLGVRCRAEV